MDKRIAIYDAPTESKQLRDEFQERYKPYLNEVGYYCFDVGTGIERDFFQQCEIHGIIPDKRIVHRKVTGKDLKNVPFYYLLVRDEREYIDSWKELNQKSGMEKVPADCQCQEYQQKNKITIDPEKALGFDIKLWRLAFSIIISPKLKHLLEENNFSGFRIIPCLNEEEEYSEEEKELNYTSDRLEQEANWFQLIVTGKPKRPPWAGTIDASDRFGTNICKVCGRISAFDSDPALDTEQYCYRPGDLNDLDLQKSDTVDSANHGEFPHYNVVVMSYRLLRFFIDNKIKGLKSWYPTLGVKYLAVCILDK